jgi:exo-beta-1,3-glucanase (GH17 family)
MSRMARAAALFLAVMLVAAAAPLTLSGCGKKQEAARDEEAGTVYLFTQTAEGGTLQADPAEEGSYLLTLTGVSPRTVYFSDRPQRNAGTLETEAFVNGWSASFGDDPPNAALVFTEAGQPGEEAAVGIISDPAYDGETGTLIYRAKGMPAADEDVAVDWRGDPLEQLPESFGAASLFIDASDAPASSSGGKLHYGLCLGLWAQPRQGWSADAAWIEKCLSTVAPYTEWITTYDCSKAKGTYDVPAAARKHGLKVAATAYITADEAANQQEIGNLVELGKQKLIDLAVVGNEPLCQPGVTVQMMTRYLGQVKQGLKGTGIRVGTRDQWGIFCAAEHRPVVDVCDFIQITAYPSTDGKPVNDAARMLLADPTQYYGRVMEVLKGWYGANLGGREVQVGETGWPSHGSENPSRYTPQNAAAYHRQVVELARQKGIRLFYFEAFDEDWKANGFNHDLFDANWGIWRWEGDAKNGGFVAKEGMLN